MHNAVLTSRIILTNVPTIILHTILYITGERPTYKLSVNNIYKVILFIVLWIIFENTSSNAGYMDLWCPLVENFEVTKYLRNRLRAGKGSKMAEWQIHDLSNWNLV